MIDTCSLSSPGGHSCHFTLISAASLKCCTYGFQLERSAETEWMLQNECVAAAAVTSHTQQSLCDGESSGLLAWETWLFVGHEKQTEHCCSHQYVSLLRLPAPASYFSLFPSLFMLLISFSLDATLLENLMEEGVPPTGKSAQTTWSLSATAGAQGGVQVEAAVALRSSGGIKNKTF